MVRYAKGAGKRVRWRSGSPANAGQDKVLFCGYHGWHDWYLAANLNRTAPRFAPVLRIEATGVPRGLAGTAIPFPYSSLNAALEDLLKQHRDQVAAVIMEPARSEMPPEGYLDEVARLTRQYGAVLIFDEVTTGFRPAADGVQSVLGVVPDLAVFAKSISNGYPMGCVVGSREVMQHAAQMFISSTYWSDTIGLRAALTTLREIRRRDVPAKVQQFGTQLQEGLESSCQGDRGSPVCGGLSVHPYLQFRAESAENVARLTTLYIQEMAKRGCHGYAAFYLNAAGEPELQQTVAAVKEVFPSSRHWKMVGGTRGWSASCGRMHSGDWSVDQHRSEWSKWEVIEMDYTQYRDEYDREGFVIVQFLPNCRGVDNLHRFITLVVPTLPDKHAFYDDKSRPETLKQMQHMDVDPYFRDYQQQSRWRRLAEDLVGEPVTGRTEWFNKPAGTNHPTPPHQDNYYFNLTPPNVLTVWLALGKVDGERLSALCSPFPPAVFVPMPVRGFSVFPRGSRTMVPRISPWKCRSCWSRGMR
ncbi:MAG: aminotransferase class III-fold pyridoxal phosphate-dependent enzyme [Planctomycetales bacterium]